MADKQFLVWDLGATKCASALVSYDSKSNTFSISKKHRVKLRECNSLFELTETIENALDIKVKDVDGICIGAAGQFNGEILHLEKNYPYVMNFKELASKHQWHNWMVTHDYVPILCATFTSYMQQKENLIILNEGEPELNSRRVVFGVGTGLGLKDGILLDNNKVWHGCNEIGLMGVIDPPQAEAELFEKHREFVRFLRLERMLEKNQAVSIEHILSGHGTMLMHKFLTGEELHTPEVLGSKVKDGFAKETLQLFAWYLGLFVGSVQLIFMPQGGIWITGGVILKHLEVFDAPEFAKGIKASPAYSHLREKFPLGVLKNNEHAFYGGAYYALSMLKAF